MTTTRDDETGRPRKGRTMVGEEFLLRVSWSCYPHHLIRRGDVAADMGIAVPNPPPTGDELERVMFAAKMAMLKELRKRRKGPKRRGGS